MKFSSQRFEVSEVVEATLIRYSDYLKANLPSCFNVVGSKHNAIDNTGRGFVVYRFEGRMDDRRKHAMFVKWDLEEIVKDPEGAAGDTLDAAEREAKKFLASAA